MTTRAGAGRAFSPKAGTSMTTGVARAHARPSAARSTPLSRKLCSTTPRIPGTRRDYTLARPRGIAFHGVVTRPPLLLVALTLACLASPACSSTPAIIPPCAVSLGTGVSDLTLVGSGACAATLHLGLRVATGAPDAPVWSDVAGAPVRVEGTWQLRGGNAVVRDVKVTNPSAQPVTLVGLEWSTDGAGVGLPVDRMLHEGYQSWSYTGVEAIPPPAPDVLGTASHAGDSEDVLGVVPGTSWWWSSLSSASGAGLVVGADGATVLKTYVAADGAGPVRLRIVQGVTGDALVLAPGESRTLDGLYLALGDVDRKLDGYAQYVASKHPPAVPRKPALGGWGSWNMYYAKPLLV